VRGCTAQRDGVRVVRVELVELPEDVEAHGEPLRIDASHNSRVRMLRFA